MRDSHRPPDPASLGAAALELPDEAATLSFGIRLAGMVQAGDMILLSGGLGAGKTVLARALIQAVCPAEEIPSPTFTLAQLYEGPSFDIVHYDLYRVESPDEIWELGWSENGSRVSLVEWPERLLGLGLAPDRLEVALAPGAHAASRRATLKGSGRWRNRVTLLTDTRPRAGRGA